MFVVDWWILVTGVLLLLGIASSKISARLGVPVLVLFLLLGMLAGSEGLGGIEFSSYPLAHAIGSLALAMILFDGGLSTSMTAVRSVWKPSAVLATLGVLITAVVAGFAAHWILEISVLEGLLLGSIVGSTDAAAVFSVLRSGGVTLPKRIASTLEVESASNDPMAIFMTVGCIELLAQRVEFGWPLVGFFASQMIVGFLVGLGGGQLATWVVNKIDLGAAGLYPILVTAFCLLTFGLAAQFNGSGFLAVYVAGVILGNRRLVFQRGIRLYHDAIAWFSQIVMFIMLGLLCFPSRLLDVTGRALAISVVLILVARPVAVLISMIPFRYNWREQAFMSWVGLKGAVPITLATFPLMLGTPRADLLFDVVFFIVVVSALVQGSTLALVAGWFGLKLPAPPAPPVTLEISSLQHVEGDIVDYAVGADSRATGRLVKDLALPDGVVIALVARGQQLIPPQGKTQILAGDHVIVVLRPGARPLVNQIFGSTDDDRGVLTPSAIEFPLRGTTTVGALQELYGIRMEVPATCTLDEAMRRELGDERITPGSVARYGPLLFRIHSVTGNGDIEVVGMSILSEAEIDVAEKREQTI